MILNDLDQAVHIEQYKDLRREADQARLIRQIKQQQHSGGKPTLSFDRLKVLLARTSEPISIQTKEEICSCPVAY